MTRASAAMAAVLVAALAACGGTDRTPSSGVTAPPARGSVEAPSSAPTADVTEPDAVAVTFDFPKGSPRPIKETSRPIEAPTAHLAMAISELTYRGVVCGFTFHGEAPPSPVTIRLHGTAPAGPFDSGRIEVAWTSLDSHAVTSGAAKDGTWNFSSEAHVDRSGDGWVVSVGGVSPAGGDEAAVVPDRAVCELDADAPVFTPATGPVGYWAGYAAV